MFSILVFILGAILLVIFYFVVIYNKFISLKNRIEEAWSDIDVQLKRRFDLIPNLVETVKGYAKHESETLTKVIEARNKAGSMKIDLANVTPEQMAQFQTAQNGLTGALGKLFALSESYPDLKANQNFLELQRELTDTENKIQSARRFFNSVVMEFNVLVESVPSNLIANLFHFSKKEMFEIDEKEREVVKVKF